MGVACSMQHETSIGSDQAPEAPPESPTSKVPLVVGLGASAGGLSALGEFFDHLPATLDACFVVIVHLSPDHESHLEPLLQRHTSMAVLQVREPVPLQPGKVYIIPPGKDLSLLDGFLRLTDPGQRKPRAEIDLFFRSLADAYRSDAVAIVLSGTGSDGAVGIKRVKELGGVTMAQSPDDAEHGSMPSASIATGFIDIVRPARELASEVASFREREDRVAVPLHEPTLPHEDGTALSKIFHLLRAATGHDFSSYKRSTSLRRLARRLQLFGLNQLDEYLQVLETNPDEPRALLRDMLISVTHFFRDPDAFAALQTKVIPQLFANKDVAEDVRVWVPGCATGEEAYSLAMLLLDEARRLERPVEIQVFASDVVDSALAQAREGLYPDAVAGDVPPEQLERYFTREPNGYRVRKAVREVVLFAQHNLLKNPPFSKLDLISCRNLLIYLRRELHPQILGLFHYALLPDGYLFLGPSESADSSDLFRPIDKEERIFQRVTSQQRAARLPSFPITPHDRQRGKDFRELPDAGRADGLFLKLIAQYAPPSVVVNEHHDIIHVFEGAERYFRLPTGTPTQHMLRLILPELRLELRAALYASMDRREPTRTHPRTVRIGDRDRLVEIVVQPIQQQELPRCFHVVFHEHSPADLEPGATTKSAASEQTGEVPAHVQADQPTDGAQTLIHQLESEVERLRDELQSSVEEHVSAMEELKSSNEELQSTNEELKSMAEELETSREELQSMNEELVTVNQEHRVKIEELSAINSDLQNFMAAADVGMLFLDRELRIRRFTPRVTDIFNIIGTDIGRPLKHLTQRIGYDGLPDDAARVLRDLTPFEQEVQSEDRRWFLIRLRPYRTIDDRIGGVVVTFVDITARKSSEQEVRRSEERYRLLIENVHEYAIFMMDAQGIVNTWNAGAQRILGYRENEIRGRHLRVLFTEEEQASGVPEAELRTAAESGSASDDRWHARKDGSRFWCTGLTAAVKDPRGELIGFAKLMRDNTERKEAEEALLASEGKLKSLNEGLEQRVEERTSQVRALAKALTLAEQRERHRIAGILHENLQQLLYGVQLKVEVLEQALLESEQPLVREQMHEVRARIGEAISMTRRLTVDLSPPVLQNEGMAESLQWLVTHMKDMHGFDVDLKVDGELRISRHELRVLLFQLVRELLFNVVKHAGVTHARVHLGEDRGHVVIHVSDDGQGFDATRTRQAPSGDGGFGLANARERLKLFGGSLEIDSAPGAGTRVTAIAPRDLNGNGG
jgi:two-component system CheB/CheR fusion protein